MFFFLNMNCSDELVPGISLVSTKVYPKFQQVTFQEHGRPIFLHNRLIWCMYLTYGDPVGPIFFDPFDRSVKETYAFNGWELIVSSYPMSCWPYFLDPYCPILIYLIFCKSMKLFLAKREWTNHWMVVLVHSWQRSPCSCFFHPARDVH